MAIPIQIDHQAIGFTRERRRDLRFLIPRNMHSRLFEPKCSDDVSPWDRFLPVLTTDNDDDMIESSLPISIVDYERARSSYLHINYRRMIDSAAAVESSPAE